MAMTDERITLTPEETKRRRARNIAIAVALGLFIVIVYAVTVVKLGPGVLQRPL
jgi:capsular polysaccharide biosynthesis protein